MTSFEHLCSNHITITTFEATIKLEEEKSFTVLWSTKTAAVMEPTSSIRAAPTIIFRWNTVDSITTNSWAITSNPIIVAITAISAATNILYVITEDPRRTVIKPNLPTAILLIIDTSVKIIFIDIIRSWAEAVRRNAKTGCWVVLFITVF